MKKQAFTMIELVMVIVVLGILAALAMPRLDRDLRQEAKDNILSAIRYTQHLALIDDKTVPGTNWQTTLWKITFSTSGDNLENFYTVSSDANLNGSVDKAETAIDPANGKYMFTDDSTIDADESPNIFIGKTYGIINMTFNGGCSNEDPDIGFDNLGRPHNDIADAENDYDEYMNSDCIIQFNFADASITPLTVTIATETGHVSAN
ncbi:type II secretion system protein [Sulfurovum sp. XTW-4]|uniref:Type II secretion system protein n=1 Tax=Sulfurovum xiamenensis TaxID=3019066 RepID=A0ABT7QP87_9BACT|nr:type II secretion system protein [Sulfurovum xiamenensis]MDM5262899.1 type II secretion system protein [Sulfurovum xiamenensis]